MSFHAVINTACKTEVSWLFTNVFDWSICYVSCMWKDILMPQHLNYTTELLAFFIIVNNLQNVSSIHQRNLFNEWSFYDTISNNTGMIKHSKLKPSCYAHCSSNARNLQKLNLDVKVRNTSVFSTRSEPGRRPSHLSNAELLCPRTCWDFASHAALDWTSCRTWNSTKITLYTRRVKQQGRKTAQKSEA